MSNLINLTVATDIEGQGGIATVLNVYRDSGFFEEQNVRLIASHSGTGKYGALSSMALYLSALLKVSFYLIFYKVGLVHIHMASRGSYLRKSILVRLVKLLGGRVLLHLHGAEFREFYKNECSPKKQAHIRKTFEMSDSVIVLSSQWVGWAKQAFKKSNHIKVLYNAVPCSELKRTHINKGLIVFLGRLGQRKGVLDLINAFVLVKKECPEARLSLGGDGDMEFYRNEVETHGLSDSVHFHGWVSGADKDQLLEEADIYTLPSYNEGFPMGVIEAMSAGIPVVSTRAGGIPDAITDKEDGLLVDAGDVDALACALIRLIKEREFNSALARSAQLKFNQQFSVGVIIPKLKSVYAELLHKEVG